MLKDKQKGNKCSFKNNHIQNKEANPQCLQQAAEIQGITETKKGAMYDFWT